MHKKAPSKPPLASPRWQYCSTSNDTKKLNILVWYLSPVSQHWNMILDREAVQNNWILLPFSFWTSQEPKNEPPSKSFERGEAYTFCRCKKNPWTWVNSSFYINIFMYLRLNLMLCNFISFSYSESRLSILLKKKKWKNLTEFTD